MQTRVDCPWARPRDQSFSFLFNFASLDQEAKAEREGRELKTGLSTRRRPNGKRAVVRPRGGGGGGTQVAQSGAMHIIDSPLGRIWLLGCDRHGVVISGEKRVHHHNSNSHLLS